MKQRAIPSQRGLAAVEFAAVMVPVVFLAVHTLLLVPHFVWQYSVLRAATANAARFAAAQSPVPLEDRMAIAAKMIEETTANAGIVLDRAPKISCDGAYGGCDSTATAVVVEASTAWPQDGSLIYTKSTASLLR